MFQVLAMCLRSALMDKNFIERTTGVSPTESQEEHLTTLAECIYYVLVSTKGIENSCLLVKLTNSSPYLIMSSKYS